LAAEHSITLNNGSTYHGRFVSGSSNAIVFEEENGTRRRFDVADVRTIDFSGSASASVSKDTGRSARDRRYGAASRQSSAIDTRVIPADSEIQVRVNETIDSREASAGRTFSGEIYQDVTGADGNVVIPRGSSAELVLLEIKEAGTVTSPELILDVQSVRVSGRRYLMSTADLEQSGREGIGKNRRTAEMVGGGAALGGLLGAIAGGGKGAVIGAIAGAAAGGAVQVITKGKEVRVPAETVLTFKLDQPVRLEMVR
jgi:hypothetical protein